MIKFSTTCDFDCDVPPVALVESRENMVKRAACRDLLKYEKVAGQTDVHIIALGAHEGTGVNRNGDTFLEEDCRKKHHTFVKAGRAVHRNHKNKPNDPKYGVIKASAYNEPMKRIELIVGLDNDKCGDIIEKVASGKAVEWSMATKQAYDICSICGHKARNDKERCVHIPKELGEITKEGKVCCMINPDPNWFEISYVKRGADRIAMTLEKKATALRDIRPVSQSDYFRMYPGFDWPQEEIIVSKYATEKRRLLKKLSEIEKQVKAIAVKPTTNNSSEKYIKEELPKINKNEPIPEEVMEKMREMEPTKLLAYLADNGIVFSSEEFMEYLFRDRLDKKDVEGAKSHVKTIFSDLEDDDSEVAGLVNSDAFLPAEVMAMIPKPMKRILDSIMGDRSILSGPVSGKIIRITISGGKNPTLSKNFEKTSSNKHYELAKVYANYKLAALARMDRRGLLDDRTLLNAIVQNMA